VDAESDTSRRVPGPDTSTSSDTAFGDFNVASDFGEVGDTMRTPAAELFFGDFAPPLEPDLVFECSASMNGEHGAVALYEDRLVVESPDEPDGEAVFPADTVRSWGLIEGEAFFALVVEADVLHRTRLPSGFKPVLRAAFTKAFGPATTPPTA
jgi:hypothetical protein